MGSDLIVSNDFNIPLKVGIFLLFVRGFANINKVRGGYRKCFINKGFLIYYWGMAQLQLNTRGQYDAQQAWESIQMKYFQRSLDIESPQQTVEIPIELLKQMSNDSHEYGRLSQVSSRSRSFSPARLK